MLSQAVVDLHHPTILDTAQMMSIIKVTEFGHSLKVIGMNKAFYVKGLLYDDGFACVRYKVSGHKRFCNECYTVFNWPEGYWND